MARAFSTSVHGKNYVLHLMRGTRNVAGVMTFCGRKAIDVNNAAWQDVERGCFSDEELCQTCLAKWRREDSGMACNVQGVKP